jgi:two-component system, sensor histidine kinase and response regulator
MNTRILIVDKHPRAADRFQAIFSDILISEAGPGEESPPLLRVFPDIPALVSAFRNDYDDGRKTPLCILNPPIEGAEDPAVVEALHDIDPDTELLLISDTPETDSAPLDAPPSRVHRIGRPADSTQLRTLVIELLRNWNERHQLQDKIQHLQIALEGAGIGLWDRNVQTGVQTLSPQGAQMLGYPPDELEPRLEAWEALIHPEDLDLTRKRMEAHFAWETPYYEAEYRVRTRSGDWKWILARGQVMEWDADGQVLRVAGTYMDISDRKEFEQELRHQRALLYSLIDSIPDLIFYKDVEGAYIGCNPAFGAFTGVHWREIQGKTDHDLFPRNLADFFREQDRLMLASEGPRSNEEWVGYPDGRQVLLDTLKTPFHGPDGEILGIVGVSRDITERKSMEEELQKAKEMAEAANQAKSEFLASMSHEIRTPMSGIIGMVDLLQQSRLNRDQRGYLDIIQKSADSLLAIINDILDISKIEAGKVELETLDFDLRTTLEDMSDLMAVKAEEKGILFTCLIDHSVPSLLRGDPGRLRQILINLIGNAIKFTEQGEVLLHVELEKQSTYRAVLEFSIRDTGIGIPSDKLDRIFNKFTQLDMSTTRQYGGTGLGLAIARQLTEMMGGRMKVESREGEGATFRFSVVLEKQPEAEQREPVIFEDLQTLRILFVDDNSTNRLVLREQLLILGCRFEEASGGAMALELLRSAAAAGTPFDIAILDQELPRMDGVTLGKQIKADPDLRGIRLIMMTSIGNRGDVSRMEAIGFAAYLVKPVRQSRLLECLRAVGAADPEARPAPGIITRHTLSENRKRHGRILLVEDNETIQLVSMEMLKQWGYQADLAENGAEAVRALETRNYHLVLMDVEMPVMDGYEATRRIRAEDSTVLDRNLPIIAMTAHAMKRDLDLCLTVGMNDYMTKPIRYNDLAVILEKYLSRNPELSESGPTGKIVFDETDISDRLDGNQKLIRMLLAEFVKNTPGRIDALRRAFREKEADQIRILGHTLKGSSATAGAPGMQALASQIESAGKSKAFHALSPLIEKLAAEFVKLKRILSEAGLIQDPGASERTPVDISAALQNMEGNRRLLKECLNDFSRNCLGMLADIRASIEADDPIHLRKAVHRLKGALVYLAAEPAGDIASRLEAQASARDLVGARQTASELVRACETLRSFAATFSE